MHKIMENKYLDREFTNARREMDGVLDKLLAYIEQLEVDNRFMEGEIDRLNDKLYEAAE